MVREFAFINFFRALAAFWVLMGHCMVWADWTGIWWPAGKIAVDVFMIISGYLMTSNAMTRARTEPISESANRLRFWLRRFFRIAPVYYFALLVAVLTSTQLLGGYAELQKLNPGNWPPGNTYDPARFEYTPTNIALHLSFLFGLHPHYSSSTFLPDWSLSLEMQFYAAFPFLMLLAQRFGLLRIALALGLPIFAVGYVFTKSVHFLEPSLLILKLNYFLAGMLLAPALGSQTKQKERGALMAAALLLVSMDIRYHGQLALLPLMLLAMYTVGRMELNQRVPAWLRPIIDSRLTRFASESSYGVYLLHGFFISGAGLILARQGWLFTLTANQRFLFIFVFVMIGSYLGAHLTYRLIEMPGIAWGRKLISRLLPSGGKLAAPAQR